MKLFYVIFLSNFYQLYCIQKLYTFVPERCDVADINYTFFHSYTYKCNKINRNILQFNVDFIPRFTIKDNSEGQVQIRTYMFRSNEYRKGPIDFTMNICDVFTRKDLDVPNLLANSNLKCPILKDRRYYVSNFSPNATNYPPLLPEGRWKIQLAMKYQDKYNIAVLNWYAAVVYPVPILPDV